MAQEAPEPSRSLNILSFDSGGPRELSQLHILKQVMWQMFFSDGDEHQDTVQRPCEVFDAIGGVGTGGLIAILLVKLELTAEQALERFTEFTCEVYQDMHQDPAMQTAKMKIAIDKLLSKHGVGSGTRLMDTGRPDPKCKLIVPIMYKDHVPSTHMLRNHRARRGPTMNLTVAEAMLATCATPPFFTPTQIKSGYSTLEFVGGDAGLSNPTREMITEAEGIFGGQKTVACILSIGSGYLGVTPMPVDSSVGSWAEFHHRLANVGEKTAQDIGLQMSKLAVYYRFPVKKGMEIQYRELDSNIGSIIAHTDVYLEHSWTASQIALCVDTIKHGDGLATLERLVHSGGGKAIAPSFPPLANNYVERTIHMESVKRAIFEEDERIKEGSKIVVVTGIGGSGKTQLIRKIVEKYGNRFISTFFIDGTSKETIERDIVRYVRSCGPDYSQATFSESMLFLSQNEPGGERLGIIDNVDDNLLELAAYLPRWTKGTIIITSRNASRGQLNAVAHIEISDMSRGEAVEMVQLGLRQAHPSEAEKTVANKLVDVVGCHPIVLVQAISYIYTTRVTVEAYINRFRDFKARISDVPPTHQVDMRYNTAYAAFDASYDLLSARSQNACHLLSFFHWQRFPVRLINIALKNDFSTVEHEYMPKGAAFFSGKQCLQSTFGAPDQSDEAASDQPDKVVDSIVADLLNHSFITVTSTNDESLLQMHPLVHEWARFRIARGSLKRFQAGATRLICCGATSSNYSMMQYLFHHAQKVVSECKDLHTNDLASFSLILFDAGIYHEAAALLERLHETLQSQLGPDDPNTIRISDKLAECYESLGRFVDAEVLRQTEELRALKVKWGETDQRTIRAKAKLTITLRKKGQNDEAEALKAEVRWKRMAFLEWSNSNNTHALVTATSIPAHPRTQASLHGAIAVGRQPSQTLMSSSPESIHTPGILAGDLSKQEESLVEMEKEVLVQTEAAKGQNHPDTLKASEDLASRYCFYQRYEDAEQIMKHVQTVRRQQMGPGHPETIKASKHLATIYGRKGDYDKLESTQEEILRQRKLTSPQHPDTFIAMLSLTDTYVRRGRRADADALAKEARASILETQGDSGELYQYACDLIAVSERRQARGTL